MKCDKLMLRSVILGIFKKNPKSTKIEFFEKNNNSCGLCPKNGPEIVEKKYTVAHSTPDVTPRKKKVRYVRGIIYGVFRYLTKNDFYLIN